MPSDAMNRGYDFLFVLPKRNGEGRVVVAIQVKDWFDDIICTHKKRVGQMQHVAREARWRRQYFTQDQVYWGRDCVGACPSQNAFRKQLQARMARAEGTADVIFVLVTPNRVGAGAADGSRVPRSTEAAEVMTAAGVLPDEGRLSLEGMKGWCPTVAHAALGVRGVGVAQAAVDPGPREGPGESP